MASTKKMYQDYHGKRCIRTIIGRGHQMPTIEGANTIKETGRCIWNAGNNGPPPDETVSVVVSQLARMEP